MAAVDASFVERVPPHDAGAAGRLLSCVVHPSYPYMLFKPTPAVSLDPRPSNLVSFAIPFAELNPAPPRHTSSSPVHLPPAGTLLTPDPSLLTRPFARYRI